MTPDDLRTLIDRYFEGRLNARETRRMFDALEASEASREYFARRQALAELDPAAPSELDRIGESLGLNSPAPAPSRRAWWWALPSAVAAGLVVLLVVRPVGDDGFTARGEGGEPHVSVFDISGAAPRPVENVIDTNASLAFAYQSPQPAYLMIFAVDADGEVYWFYPAWTDPADNPAAIAVEPSTRPQELPEAVRHRWQPGPLHLFALFLPQPLQVRTVEARLPRQVVPGQALPFKGSQWSMSLRVEQP